MGLNKVTYVDHVTVISAQNLNDIQDAVIANEDAIDNIASYTYADDGDGNITISSN